MQSLKHWFAWTALFVTAAACHRGDTSSSTSSEDSGDASAAEHASSEDSAATVSGGARQPASGGGAPAAGSPEAAPDDGSRDRVDAVDVGNPDDTGPKPEEGKLKLYLADAPVADGLEGLLIRPTAIRLVDAFGQVQATFPLDGAAIDLMDYTEGEKLLIYEGDAPTGDFTEIQLVLDQDEPATAIRAGNPEKVLVPALSTAQGGPIALLGEKALFGDLTLAIRKDEVADVTVHVDLRRQLRRVAESLPLNWIFFAPDALYWLDPESPAFLSDAVGALAGIGLSELTKVVCAYKVNPSTPLNVLGIPLLTGADADSGCAHAQGSAVVHDLSFHVAYLPPGTYGVRLFIGDSIYLDLPGLHAVTEGALTFLDL